MKFIYACDIHGDTNKYKKLLEIANRENIKYMVLGGDLLPKICNDRRKEQKAFIKEYLNNYFAKLKTNDIKCICILGNDDMEILDTDFSRICKRHPNIYNIDNKKVDIEDVSFIGLSKVLDHPFGCKDRVVVEENLPIQMQLSYQIWINKCKDVITANEWEIKREQLVSNMEDVLNKLPKRTENKKTIYVFHNPPYGIGLDVCGSGMQVGSKSMTKFIENSNAYMSLHGHIHESPIISRIWRNNLGNTICIQPGQTELRENSFIYVIADTDKNENNIIKESIIEYRSY